MKQLLTCVFTFIMTMYCYTSDAQDLVQNGIVRKITHSKSEKTVPVQGVRIVAGGVSSNKSDGKGRFKITLQGKNDDSFVLQDVRFPLQSEYILAYPSLNQKLYFSENDITIALTTDEEISTISKSNYNRLFKKYRERESQLMQDRNRLEELQLELDESQEKYAEISYQLDSVQYYLSMYFDEERSSRMMKELERIAEELATTDYQSLDATDMPLYDLRYEGSWEQMSSELQRVMNGDAMGYLREGLDNLESARDIAMAADAELANRFRRMELAIEAFEMRFENDSVSRYYEILTQADSTNFRYLNNAGTFEHTGMGNQEKALSYFNRAFRYAELDTMKAGCYNNIGNVYMKMGNYDEALRYFEKGIDLMQKSDQSSKSLLATCYNSIGQLCDNLSDYDKAVEYYNKALEIYLSLYGKYNKNISICYNNLGTLYKEKGDIDKALEYINKALEVNYEIYDEDNAEIAATYNNLGYVYTAVGRYEDALKYTLKSYEILKKIHKDANHYNIASSLNNIGAIYEMMEDFDKSIEYRLQSLNMYIAMYGEIHPDVAIIYNNIGMTKAYIGDNADAINYDLKALELMKMFVGENHAIVATIYNNIGMAESNLGNNDKAIDYYTRGLNIRLSIYGSDNPDVAVSYNNIAMEHRVLGNYDKALVYMLKAKDICDNTNNIKTPNGILIMENLSTVYEAMNDYDKELECLMYAVSLMKEVHGEVSKKTAFGYCSIAQCYARMGDSQNALSYVEKGIETFKKMDAANHFIPVAYNIAGNVCKTLNNKEGTLKYLEKAIEHMHQYNNTETKDYAVITNNLSHAYEEVGNYEKAIELCNLSIETYKKLDGDESINVGNGYLTLCKYYIQTKDMSNAAKFSSKAYNLFLELLGADNELTKDAEKVMKEATND